MVEPLSLDSVFWTQVGTTITILLAILGLYRTLTAKVMEQKNATIELLNSRISHLEQDLARQPEPDALLSAMADRKKLLEDELASLRQDLDANKELIAARAAELGDVTQELEQLKDLASEYLCPDCGALMTVRVYGEVRHGGRSYETERVAFACGREYGPFQDTPCPSKA